MDDATAEFRAVLFGTATIANAVADKMALGLYSEPGSKDLLLRRAQEAHELLVSEAAELAAAIKVFETSERCTLPNVLHLVDCTR